MDKFTSLE